MINTIVVDSEKSGVSASENNLFARTTDQAYLGALLNNGGPTVTHELRNGSPAIEGALDAAAPVTDQRGLARPQGQHADIGAVELAWPSNAYALTLEVNGPGTVTLSNSSNIVEKVMFSSVSIHPANSTLLLTAIPSVDHAIHWSGDGSGSVNPLPIRMDRDRRVTADFVYQSLTVTNPPGWTNYVCTTNGWGVGSFRQAILDANASGGAAILFSNLSGMVYVEPPFPPITGTTLICGSESNQPVIGSFRNDTLFRIGAGATCIVSHVTIQTVRPTNDAAGGAFANAGHLVLEDVQITGCRAKQGGAIYSSGWLAISNSTISYCGAIASPGSGGGIASSGTCWLVDSVVRSCRADASDPTNGGGGIFIAGGSALILHSLIESNELAVSTVEHDSLGGAGVYVGEGQVTFLHSTISRNVAAGAEGRVSGGPYGYYYGGAGGGAGGSGLALQNGVLVISNCIIAENRARGGNGGDGWRSSGQGGVAKGGGLCLAGGTTRIVDCSVLSNQVVAAFTRFASPSPPVGGAAASGAAIQIVGGYLLLLNATVTGNEAVGGDVEFSDMSNAHGGSGSGAGIMIQNAIVDAVNCTISGNLARSGFTSTIRSGLQYYPPEGTLAQGAGIFIDAGRLRMTNCTITLNMCRGGAHPVRPGNALGGGLYVGSSSNQSASALLLNTILAGNSGTAQATNVFVASESWGPITSLGHNLFGSTNDLTGWSPTDLLNADPRLGPLQDNGGPTLTHALLVDSPAIDAGVASHLASDQRGQPRTVDAPGMPNASESDGTDIGALEMDPTLRFTEVHRWGSEIHLRFTTVSDQTYGLEYTPSVPGGVWTPLPAVIAGTGGIVTMTNQGEVEVPQRFYRARQATP